MIHGDGTTPVAGQVPGPGVGVAEQAAMTEPQHRMEDVVKRTGLTPRAIRYYEEVGLLAAASRTAGGFRLFTEDDIATLLRIKELQALLGFSLAEIKESLHIDAMRAELRQAYAQATDLEGRLAVIAQAETLLESQIGTIDERARRLTQLRQEYSERLARLRAVRTQVLEERPEGEPSR